MTPTGRGARGALIVIEGIDGAGKSTQAARLAGALAADGYDVRHSREPTDGPHGRRIREMARAGRGSTTPEAELALFLDDRRAHVADVIAPALAEGGVVLLDRYYLSTMAYQGALGLDPAAIQAANEAFAPRPDLALVLALPIDAALARIRAGRPEGTDAAFERADYLGRVAAIFADMAERFPPGVVEIVDASGDADRLADRLASLAGARLRALGAPRR
jgi:dTMP kinase